MTVAADERFRHLDTKWSFWVVSNDLDKYAQNRTKQKDKPRGLAFDNDQVRVWVKTWSEILAEATSRMRFVQEHLKANVDADRSLQYLQQTYQKYLSGIEQDDDEAA